MTDFETWLHDYGDRIYRYWVYRRMFTPEEQNAKYIDQSFYECDECSFGLIKEAVELPDGDILLGIADVQSQECLEYYKLSELRIGYYGDEVDDFD